MCYKLLKNELGINCNSFCSLSHNIHMTANGKKLPLCHALAFVRMLHLDCCNVILATAESIMLQPGCTQPQAARLSNGVLRIISSVRELNTSCVCMLTHLAVKRKSPAYLASLLTLAKSCGSTSWSADRADMLIHSSDKAEAGRASQDFTTDLLPETSQMTETCMWTNRHISAL